MRCTERDREGSARRDVCSSSAPAGIHRRIRVSEGAVTAAPAGLVRHAGPVHGPEMGATLACSLEGFFRRRCPTERTSATNCEGIEEAGAWAWFRTAKVCDGRSFRSSSRNRGDTGRAMMATLRAAQRGIPARCAAVAQVAAGLSVRPPKGRETRSRTPPLLRHLVLRHPPGGQREGEGGRDSDPASGDLHRDVFETAVARRLDHLERLHGAGND